MVEDYRLHDRDAELAEDGVQQINGILNFVSYFVGAILAVAATIGSANALYALVDSRRRELATLRAIGFSGAPVIAATLLEAILYWASVGRFAWG